MSRKHFVWAILLLGISVNAAAVPIVVSQLQNQTATGQLFDFALTAPLSDGTGGTLSIRARGDYGDDNDPTFEVYSWHAENLLGAGPIGGFDGNGDGVGGRFDGGLITHAANRNYEFTRSYALTGAELLALTADGLFGLSVQLGGGVNVGLEPGEFTEVTLAYASDVVIDEPASVGLLVAGLVLAGSLRRIGDFAASAAQRA